MAIKKPLSVYSGKIKEIASADVLAGTGYYDTAISRATIVWVDTDTITIGVGKYFHTPASGNGAVYWWEADLTFNFSSLGASQLQYIYIDWSVATLRTDGELIANCFYNSTTAPTWSDTRKCWYHGTNTDDMCISGFNTNSSSQIREFVQTGKRVAYLDRTHSATIMDIWSQSISAWYTVALDFPNFVRLVEGNYTLYSTSANAPSYVRPKGGSGNGTQMIFTAMNEFITTRSMIEVNSSQEFEIVGVGTCHLFGNCDVFYLGEGQ